MLVNTRIDPASKYRSPWIEGYASQASVSTGQNLRIMVSTDPVSEFSIDIYRLGYYAGAGGRLVHSSGKLSGKKQPMPEVGA